MIGTLAGFLIAGVVAGVVLGRHRREVAREAAETQIAQLPAQLPREKSCAETAAQPTETPLARDLRSPSPPRPEATGPPAPNSTRSAHCLVGIRPDGGTRFSLLAPSEGWAPEIHELRHLATAAQRAHTLGGLSVLYRLRGKVLEIHIPKRARLLITDEGAELEVEARAIDLGGIIPWGSTYLNWASRCLGVEACTGLHDAARAGWLLSELPLCAEFSGMVLRSADALRDRWVGVGRRTRFVPIPGDDDEIATLYIGGKRAAFYLKAYLKSRELELRQLVDSTLSQRLREGGWDGSEPVLRLEAVFREEGLMLRPRGDQGHEDLGFRDPAILADVEALARLWAYAFGHAAEPQSGRFRLLDQACKEVDPRWLAVQAAGAAAPHETLAQVRERRKVERRARRATAERRWIQSVGEVARFDGYAPGADANEVREHMTARTGAIEQRGIHEALLRADALFADLLSEDRPRTTAPPRANDPRGTFAKGASE